MTSVYEAQDQDADIQAPRRGQAFALAVDATARAYDITNDNWNGNAYQPGYSDHVFLDLQNDGANPIYYYFDIQGAVVDMNVAIITAAGTTPVLDTRVPKVLRSGQDTPVRIDRVTDKFLHVVSALGSTLRVCASSLSSPKVQ